MTRVALLDVNVLVALFDPDHINHDPAHDWLTAHRPDGWATCPITENGLVGILSNASYSAEYVSAAEVRERLAAFCRSGDHVFWADDVSLRDERLFGLRHAQITDVYLLGLAVRKGGRLATFDRHIPPRAVVGADTEHRQHIPA
jgi:toxin-antitoxin system PIN domain toxin